jgi:hypothetical protein
VLLEVGQRVKEVDVVDLAGVAAKRHEITRVPPERVRAVLEALTGKVDSAMGSTVTQNDRIVTGRPDGAGGTGFPASAAAA